MKYKVQKKIILTNILFTIIFSALYTVISWWFSLSIAYLIIPAFVIFMWIALSDIKAYVYTDSNILRYYRYGRDISVDWASIQRLEHRKLIWKKGFARMMIHTSAPNIVICIETSFENYPELCDTIIKNYANARENPCIDEELIKYLGL